MMEKAFLEEEAIVESAGAVKALAPKTNALIGEGYSFSRTAQGTLGMSLSINTKRVAEGSIYLFSFKGQTESYRTLTVQICNSKGTVISEYAYKLSAQCTEITMPFKATAEESEIRILFDGTLGESVLGDFDIVKSDSTTIQGTKSGYYMVEDDSWEAIDADYADSRISGTSNCRDVMVTSNGYIYALAANTLMVFKENGTAKPDFIWKDETNSLGDIRQMDISEDETLLALIARSAGTHIYDITNKEQLAFDL